MSEFRIVRIDIAPDCVTAVYPDLVTAEAAVRGMWQDYDNVGVLNPQFEWQQHFYRIEQWDEGEESFTTQWRIDYDSGDMLVVRGGRDARDRRPAR